MCVLLLAVEASEHQQHQTRVILFLITHLAGMFPRSRMESCKSLFQTRPPRSHLLPDGSLMRVTGSTLWSVRKPFVGESEVFLVSECLTS